MADKIYDSPEELRAAVANYFSEMERRDLLPDYAGMKLAIGIKSEHTIAELCKDPEYKDIFDWAMLRRESYLVRTMSKDNKRAQGCFNALKQKVNGGYTDKPVDTGERKLIIELSGIGENAYK